jgi:hypothetical protein
MTCDILNYHVFIVYHTLFPSYFVTYFAPHYSCHILTIVTVTRIMLDLQMNLYANH